MQSARQQRIRVLLADDHRVVRQGFRLILTQQPDIDVVGEASSGREAADLAVRLEPDVVILDIAMPAMSGIDLQRELQCRGYAIPIVFITAQQDEAVRGRVIAYGAVACLSKPLSEVALLEALDALFGKT